MKEEAQSATKRKKYINEISVSDEDAGNDQYF
jgi:hypothetical protein